jgi:hypothetical protein
MEEVEVAPANPEFDDMRAAFLIVAGDVGEQGYDVVAAFVHQWLIDHDYYEGISV